MKRRLVLLTLAIASTASNIDCWFGREIRFVTCPTLNVVLRGGECQAIVNPCGIGWAPPGHTDGFSVGGTDALFAKKEVSLASETSWFICAAPRDPSAVDAQYTYSTDAIGSAVGIGVLKATVNPAVISVNVSAVPAFIRAGERSQLAADASGGTPPYTFAWSPREALSADPHEGDPALQRPVATPLRTTIFTIMVTDATGATNSGSVAVRVELLAEPTASPSTIVAGESSHLDANPSGGDGGDYTYVWEPPTGLSDRTIRDPIASPATTTDYTVTVSDHRFGIGYGHVVVSVLAAPALSASFTFAQAARTLHWTFDGSASTGKIASYTWDLLGHEGTSIHRITAGPVLETDIPEAASRGSMTLTVTAVDGSTASLTRSYP